jgi:hypothetical protein
MSPAPETVRRPSNARTPALLPAYLQMAGANRTAANETPGPFSADRRVNTGIRRNFSGGPRPAPFSQRIQSSGASTSASTAVTASQGDERNSAQAMLMSVLEHRRSVDELRGQSDIATTIADQWRRQRETMGSGNYRRISSPEMMNRGTASVAPRLLLDDTSDSESEDENDDNKWGMNEVRRTPPPTFLTPNTSPSTSTEAPNQDDDSSRNAYTLSCRFCANVLTKRGMRARLVADARVHIWSTDEHPRYHPCGRSIDSSVKMVGQKYATTTCQCQLMYIPKSGGWVADDSDIACARCETVVGYHIAGSQPCDTCSRSNHNAHYHLLRSRNYWVLLTVERVRRLGYRI